VEVGKEAYSLFILDKSLVQEARFSKDISSVCNNLFSHRNKVLESSCNHASKPVSLDVWHNRVAHIPFRRMKLWSLGIDFDDVHHLPCDICPKAK